MAGNSQRRGAKRTGSSKKGASVGSGGQRRQGLEPKGPTPPAEARKGHPAARRAAAAQRRSPSRPASRPKGTKESAEVVYGRNSVVEVLRAGVPVQALYVADRIDVDDRVREVLKIAQSRQLPLLETTRADIDRVTSGGVHQGLALQIPAYDYAHPDDLLARANADRHPALIVALDGVTDPRNLGAVVRSAAAFGAHGVLVPERRAAGVTASAWKTSAGAAARVPVARATNLTRALQAYQKAGVVVVGLDADGATPVDQLEAAVDPLVLVIGSEGKGLSRLVAETCDLIVSIPMASSVESLNAGVAAGIALHAIASRRQSA